MQTQKDDLQHKIMTEESVKKLVLRLGAPTTVGLMIISLYSLADAFFVSALGTAAGAAVGVSFSIVALLQAVGYTLGLGAGSLMSRALGRKEREQASAYASLAFWLGLASGALILACGLLFHAPIMRFLGANESIFPLALEYSRALFWAAPFTCGTFVLSQLLRSEGHAVYSMLGLVCGGLLNILLDPLFITTLNMGVAGASRATLISQALSFSVLLSAYLTGHSKIRLFQGFQAKRTSGISSILITGLPSTARQGLIVLSTVLLNHTASSWSDAALSAISVVTRLFLLAFGLCLGIAQGMMPVVGYNYGSRRYGRVREAYRFSTILSSFLMLAVGIPMMLFAPQLIAFFRDESEVIAIGAPALRAQSMVLVLHGLITCTILLLQALGNSFFSTALASARQGFFFVPLLFLLPSFFGIESIILIQPLADAATFLFAIPFAHHAYRQLKRKNAAGEKLSRRGADSDQFFDLGK